MRNQGRVLYPTTDAERTLFALLGVESIRVPRSINPYVVARRAKRAALLLGEDTRFLRTVIDVAASPRESIATLLPMRPVPGVEVSVARQEVSGGACPA